MRRRLMVTMSLLFTVSLIALQGCNTNTDKKDAGDKKDKKAIAAATGNDLVLLEVDEIELVPGAEKQVQVKAENVEAEVPSDSGLTAKREGRILTVSAAKDAKQGTHLISLKAGNAKHGSLKVHLKATAAASLTTAEAQAIGADAYIYGYPLVTMELTRRVMTNVAEPDGKFAPMGQFARLRNYPTPKDKEVTAPNADTLYTLAWLDVAKEPWVLSIPDAKDRYYLMPLLDGWTTVFEAPGKRTTGTAAQKYVITGPGWKGELPAGLKHYESPTALVWILGRIYCDGTPADYKAVHDMQDQCSLVPLSSFDKPYTLPKGTVDPAVDMKMPVREQVDRMDATAYFTLLATLLKDNPPTTADAPIVARMAKIGLVPGEPFDAGKLVPEVAKSLEGVPKAAVEQIMAHLKKAGKDVNGWLFSTQTGIYGTDYLQRATVTAIGLGANRAQDAIYPTSETATDGKPYDGANKYVMHFAKGQMPPVKGFWSLTMYDAQYFFVPNPLDRYTLSERNKLKENADGSVDLYIQKDNPGPAKESNWLPAPAGRFILMLRFYWPDETLIDGTWKPPAVTRVD